MDGYFNDKEVCDTFANVFQSSFGDLWSGGWVVDKLNDMSQNLHNCFRDQ